MITLEDMVRTESVTSDGARLLRSIAVRRQSFIVYALPRNAGKTTLTQAILAAASHTCAIRPFLGTAAEVDALRAQEPGYLTVAEIGHRGMPGYLVGEEVVRAFRLVADGWALASSLHADSVDGVFDVLGQQGVADAADVIRYLVKVRALGDPNEEGTPRVVDAIHEVRGSEAGKALATLCYRWPGRVPSDTPEA